MGVQVFESEVVLAVPPKRLFKAVAKDFQHLVVKIMPDLIESVDLTNGDGGVGTIKQINLREGLLPIKTVKERVDVVDEEKLFYSFTVIEGEFAKGVEKIQNDVTFVATPDGAGTVMKRKSHFYTTGDDPIDQSELKGADEKSNGLFKGLEAYLNAHPDA